MNNIINYSEPTTKAVSINENPTDYSTDNGVLFTSVAYQLNLIPAIYLDTVAIRYADKDKLLLRYPGTSSYMSYDDNIGITSCFIDFNRWSIIKRLLFLPDGNWLGRFVVLDAMLIWPLFPLAAFAYILDCFHKRSDQGGPNDAESGRQLLWLAGRFFWEHNVLMRPVIWLWRKVMMTKYPQGLKSLFTMYYKDPDHPFHDAARSDFK